MLLAERAAQHLNGIPGVGQRGGFAPVGDGRDLPDGEFYTGRYSTWGTDVPMLLCSTFHEWNPDRDDPELESVTTEGVVGHLTPVFGERAGAIVEAYAKSFPELRPIELWSVIVSNRRGVVHTADVKCREQQSPVYMAWFGWESPLFDGRHRAFHCLDICFWFLNLSLIHI